MMSAKIHLSATCFRYKINYIAIMFQFVILLKFWGHLHVILLVWTGLEIKRILRLSFGDQLEKYNHQMQIFSHQFE